MALILAILSLLTALLPVADRGMQQYQQYRHAQGVSHSVLPPEAGQANVVFQNGEWWKYENGIWLVWRQHREYLAQGGAAHVSR